MTQNLVGKIALVTGAARGIGRASAVALARAGADVIGADICGPVSSTLEVTPATREELAETGRTVSDGGRRWRGVTFDQRDIAAVRAAAEQIRNKFGGLDIVVATAGVQTRPCAPPSAGKAGTSRTNPTSSQARRPKTSNGGSPSGPRPSRPAT
jgi:NAD(P)-dependent dehydrogenase (short-subunit alcohol dehydrogenase family)